MARALLASGGARIIVLPVTGITSLLLARFVTDAVGVTVFGAVMLIATLSQLLTFADLGANAAVATASAELDGTEQRAEQLRRVMLSALRIVLLASTVLCLVALGVGLAGQWPRLLGLSEFAGSSAANVATVLALLAFSLALPLTLAEPLLRGSGHLHQAVLLTGLATPTALVLAVLLRLAHTSPFAYALVIPLGASLAAALTAIAGARHMRGVLRGVLGQVLRPRRFPGVPILATAAPWFVVMLGLPVALQTDRIVIAHRASAATSLADYSYASQLYGPLWSVVAVAALGLWPVFAGKAGPESRRRAWLKAVALLGAFGTAFAVGFLVLSGVVIGWVSGGASDPPFSLLVSFALLLTVQSLHVGTGIMLISPVQLRFQAVCVGALVLTNLPLSWLLAPVLGSTGPVIASAITVTVCQLIPGVIAAYRWTAAQPAAGETETVPANESGRHAEEVV